MHQPFYQDLATGEHVMPWVRLHGLKDYWGMVSLLREFPDVRLTFNLVPSLLVQLGSFARDEARDRHLHLGLAKAGDLSDEDRAFCLDQFFHAHRPTMIAPYPRYAELLARRDGGVGAFSTEDFRDLQVWHKLAWVDQEYRDHDPRVRQLLEKGRGYSETDKTTLRNIELEILQQIVPEYRQAQARGQVELATSPFYHPILPLLCDSDIYLRTHPDAKRPRAPFRRPEDARAQLQRARQLHESLFGVAPVGLWPSEGSVSDEMVELVAEMGFEWMATDEEILARSLGRGLSRDGAGRLRESELLYQAYAVGVGKGQLSCAFRDHTLSDLVGFSYSSWPADAAADDFVRRLLDAGRDYRAKTGRDGTVFVVLDGENAWEYYADQGRPFLRALYGRLSGHPELETVTMRDACDTPSSTVHSIFPGSWINGDFYIWIGHQDDQRAWSQLGDARAAIDAATGLSVEAHDRAYEELLIAEGSDWFWWYGDDHSSEHDSQFDDLFRRHLRNVYRALNLPVPTELFSSNITTRPVATPLTEPSAAIAPTIDGEVTSYFEWLGAGQYEASLAGGAMHQVSDPTTSITRILFGRDAERLCLRIEATCPARMLQDLGLSVTVTFLTPSALRLTAEPHIGSARLWKSTRAGEWALASSQGADAAFGTVLELSVPRSALGVDTAAFVVALTRGDAELEHHPPQHPITVALGAISGASWSA